ncbi:MAG TPA: hypothetical protein VN814_05605 [Caulobacteraceae bacterium]|nr:hypothetical protein [Caulobacteraceae bacterium]
MAKHNEKPLHIDMPFGEALERFIGADPAETRANIDIEKGKKSPAAQAREAGDKSVTQLSRRRKPNDVRKLVGK